MNEKTAVIASFTPKDGARSQYLDTMLPMVAASRTEPGNEMYDLYEDTAGDFHLIEIYTDSAALDAHRATPHFAAYRASAADALDGPVRVMVLNAVDVAS